MIKEGELIPYKKPKGSARIVTVTGGKGGIGKTFFSVNFAVELKNRGYKVLIFDADINLSNVNILTHIDDNGNFKDFLDGNLPIESVIQKGVGGVDVIYVGDKLKNIIDLDDKDIEKIFNNLANLESYYDYIIVDTPAGLSEQNLKLMFNSDNIILIANPEITALVDLYKLIKVVVSKKPGIKFEIVVNKSTGGESAIGIFKKISNTVLEFKLKTDLSFLGYILNEPKRVLESIQKRTPIIILHDQGTINECFNIVTNAFLKISRIKRKMSFFYSLIGK